ncbi:MAG: hypothetical protein Q9163_004183 [Psora crenata]
MTPAMVSALKLFHESGLSLADGDDIMDAPDQEPAVGKPISHGQLIELSRRLKKATGDRRNEEYGPSPSHTLDQLLRGSQVYVEPPKPRAEPTLEYKNLMARLRREEEARAYERMINPSQPAENFLQRFPNSSHPQLFPASQADVGEDDEITYADVNRQMTLIINIMISIVACSVAIWLAARHWSTPSRLGLSMVGSGMIGVAEFVVYAGYLRKLKEAREKGTKELENKEIVKSWVIGGDEEKDSKKQAVPIITKASYENDVRRRRALAKER